MKNNFGLDKIILLTLTSIIIYSFSFGIGLNLYYNNNVHYKTDNKKIFRKIDGPFGYTQLVINEDNSVEILRFSLTNSRYYKAESIDANVDEVYKEEIFKQDETFYADEHSEKYPQVFEKVNRDFRKQTKRFEHTIEYPIFLPSKPDFIEQKIKRLIFFR